MEVFFSVLDAMFVTILSDPFTAFEEPLEPPVQPGLSQRPAQPASSQPSTNLPLLSILLSLPRLSVLHTG